MSNSLGKNTKLETEKTDLGTEKDDLHEKYIALDKENQELKKEVAKLKAKLKSEASEGDVIDESHKCLICYKTFTKNANLKNHVTTVHNEKKRFKCDRCDYTTNVKFNFQQHAFKHSKKNSKKMFSCVECKFKTDYKSSYNNHWNLKHKETAKKAQPPQKKKVKKNF